MPTYNHEWQCLYCGKTIKRTTSNPNPPTPLMPNNCNGNPAAPKNKEHFMVKKQFFSAITTISDSCFLLTSILLSILLSKNTKEGLCLYEVLYYRIYYGFRNVDYSRFITFKTQKDKE